MGAIVQIVGVLVILATLVRGVKGFYEDWKAHSSNPENKG
jgi:hypothetical protein